ncbi:MAG TPA: hypothetical protein VML55_01935 [Planctomycetaceae bacterium]|nr:hypothetical protein [Planctomycetaceae bacterium]
MDQVEAYAALVHEMEQYRRLPYDELWQLAGDPPAATKVRAGPQELTLEVRVRRLSGPCDALRIEGTAYGPNWWKLERLDESITVQRLDQPAG